MFIRGEFFEHRLQVIDESRDVRFADEPPIDLNSLGETDQVRRREQPNAQASSPINTLQHRTGGTFAVRARDVDETQPILWIAHERGKLERVVQPQLRAKKAEAIKKLDCVGVSHLIALPLEAISNLIF
jgi:hypothetical protein